MRVKQIFLHNWVCQKWAKNWSKEKILKIQFSILTASENIKISTTPKITYKITEITQSNKKYQNCQKYCISTFQNYEKYQKFYLLQ